MIERQNEGVFQPICCMYHISSINLVSSMEPTA